VTAREVLGGIKGRLTKATPGPWKIDKEDPTPLVSIVSIAEDQPWGWVEVARSLDTDAEFIAAAPVDVARLTRAVEAVLAVHEPVDAVMNPGRHERIVKVCTGCGTDDGNWQRWPCPTVAGVEAALNPKEGR